jgi:hypothetical protein
LADLFESDDEGDVECGAMLVVPAMAYERVTGQRDGFYSLAKAADATTARGQQPVEADEDFDFDDDAEMRRRLPRLWALFGYPD